MKDATPDCCKECKMRDNCRIFKRCGRWIKWFRFEWANIRRAAAIIKEREG